jgi:hypothetical protein
MALRARPSEGGSVYVEDECFELLAVNSCPRSVREELGLTVRGVGPG